MDSGIGTSGSHTKPNPSEEEEEVKVFVSQMLMSRVFLGDFQERRYVELVNSYRDVVVIDQQHGDLKRDLDIVRKRLDGFYNGRLWVGITGPNTIGAPSGHCLWVRLKDQPLGQYWFIINRVTFLNNEVIVKLKQVRMASNNSKPLSEEPVENVEGNDDVLGFLSNLNMESISTAFTTQVIPAVRSVLTYHNVKEAVLFLSVLSLALVTGLLNCLHYLGDFSIRFLREFNGFIHAITPFMLGVLELISKVIGGFYILLAMLWRGNRGPPVSSQQLMGMNRSQHPQLGLPPAPSQQMTYANFRQRYQNHDRHRSTGYSKHY